jgi:hypothetical protein
MGWTSRTHGKYEILLQHYYGKMRMFDFPALLRVCDTSISMKKGVFTRKTSFWSKNP